MPPAYRFVDRWVVRAPLDRVYETIGDVLAYERYAGAFAGCSSGSRAGGAGGAGAGASLGNGSLIGSTTIAGFSFPMST